MKNVKWIGPSIIDGTQKSEDREWWYRDDVEEDKQSTTSASV